jgi:hypothetical protein
LVVCVVFAIIGVIVALFYGLDHLKTRSQIHSSRIWRGIIVDQYIVEDLQFQHRERHGDDHYQTLNP